jgi:hypothetical protein
MKMKKYVILFVLLIPFLFSMVATASDKATITITLTPGDNYQPVEPVVVQNQTLVVEEQQPEAPVTVTPTGDVTPSPVNAAIEQKTSVPQEALSVLACFFFAFGKILFK